MRTNNAIKNSSFAIIQKLFEVFLSFAFRTVLIKTLGNTYLGLSGLFTNVFSILSLAELGVSSSIVYLMYEPLKNNDTKKLQALLRLYSNFFNFLGFFVLIVGLLLIPFLPYIINEYDLLTINIIPIYILTLLNVVCTYFLAYRRSLLEADQKAYINSANYSFYAIIGTIVKIFILIIAKNYILTLVVTLMMTIMSNVAIYVKTNKMYSYLPIRSKEKLNANTKKELLKRIFASSIHQIGNIVLTSTDNIIISTFLGLAIVGKYSNYTLITNIIYSMFSLVFCSITANVGNMKVSTTSSASLSVFNKLYFLNFYMYFVACTVFGSMINNMIILWIGSDYIFDFEIVLLITISLYVQGMRHVTVTFLNSSGLNYNTRYKSIFEIIINLIVSIVLCQRIGLAGVIIGTIFSLLVVSSWYEPYVLFKNWFKSNFVAYYIKYVLCFVFMLLQTLFLYYLVTKFSCSNIVLFIIFGIASFILSNLVFVIAFFKTSEFKYYISLIKEMISKVLRRKVNE